MDTDYRHILGSYNPRDYTINLPQYTVDFSVDKKNPSIPILFHEYIHYYLHFNSLYNLEGQIYFFMFITALIFKLPEPLKNLIPLKDSIKTMPEKSIIRTVNNYLNKHYKRKGDILRADSYLNKVFADFDIIDFSENHENFDLDWTHKKFKLATIKIANKDKSLTEDIVLGEDIINESIAFIIEIIISNNFKLEYGKDIPLSSSFPYCVLSTIWTEPLKL